MTTITRKTCLITGCSEGGAGAGLAKVFHGHGYHVFVTARTTSKVPQAFHTASNATVLALDVASTESINAAVTTVRNLTGGKLDILINNAGRGLNMPALDVSIEEAKRLFDANFFGVLQTIQAFQHMLVNARGVVVNNTSMGGYLPIPFISTYLRDSAFQS
jgi:1-acylglycerone phosphate reductase